MPPPAKKQHPSPAHSRDRKTPDPVGALHPSPAAQSIAAARPHDTIRRSSHERHRPADPDAAPGKETAPVPSPDGEGIKGRGDRAEFRPIYFARSPHGARIRSFPVVSAAGRLNTPRPEQSRHRAGREDASQGLAGGQGGAYHSFAVTRFLQRLVLSLTEFVREEDPGSMQPKGRLHVHSLRVTFDPPPTPARPVESTAYAPYPAPVGAMHPSAAAQTIAKAHPPDTVRRSSHERHRPAGPRHRPPQRNSTRPLPGRGGDQGEGRPRRVSADLLRPVAAWIPDPLTAGDERRRPTQHTAP